VSVAAVQTTAPANAPVLAAVALAKAGLDHDGLAGFDLAVPRGAHVALFGAAGAGKSLALQLLLGLAKPDAGRALLFGDDPAGPRAATLRARLGFVPAQDGLFADRSVEENVALALPRGRHAAARARAVRESLLLVGLKHVEHVKPGSLAPGVRRRVALARAIAHAPELLVVDEPVACLDPAGAAIVATLVAQLRERLGLTLLVATRDPRGFEGADRVAFLHGGRIQAEDAPAALRTRADAALQQLLCGRPFGPLAS
jgi:ABC-type transporter Mla maintaining outer membrane lipid asymmetry ATPase subunit MlaF